jgi:hypothetical protein
MIVGTGVKPAQDTDGKLMIPITSQAAEFVVSFTYLTPLNSNRGAQMGSAGRLSIDLMPKFEIPINSLAVQLFLPDGFKYSEFRGNIREIDYLSVPLVQPPCLTSTVQELHSLMPSRSAVVAATECFEVNKPALRTQAAGITSLTSSAIARTQTVFSFQKLLVLSQRFAVRVDYKEIQKGYFARRRI